MATLLQTPATPGLHPAQGGPPPAQAAALEGTVQAPARASLRELMPGEVRVAALPGPDGASFVLTDRRVIRYGGGEEEEFYSSLLLEDIASVALTRRARDRKSLIWAGLGFAGAVGVWQVSSSSAVGGAGGAVVALVSLGLVADYWVRPGGLALVFTSAGGTVRGPVEGKHAARAEAFMAQVEEARTARRKPVPAAASPGPASPQGRPAYPSV